MILYHGSPEIIREPKIVDSNRLLDYGKGFYTTTSMEQADMWVRRKLKQTSTKIGYVNFYEFNNSNTDKLDILWYNEPSEEWLDFVMLNRTNKAYNHNRDIVYGPVANDRVYAAFALYESGIYNKQDLIRELKTYALVNQMLFHTEKSLNLLSFIEAREVIL